VPAYEVKFRQEAIIRTVHHGTHIEGNPLNTGQVAAVLEGKEVTARDRDIQEILNYRNVLKYIDQKKTASRMSSVSVIRISDTGVGPLEFLFGLAGFSRQLTSDH